MPALRRAGRIRARRRRVGRSARGRGRVRHRRRRDLPPSDEPDSCERRRRTRPRGGRRPALRSMQDRREARTTGVFARGHRPHRRSDGCRRPVGRDRLRFRLSRVRRGLSRGPRSRGVLLEGGRGRGEAPSHRGSYAGCGLWLARTRGARPQSGSPRLLSRAGAGVTGYLQRLAASVGPRLSRIRPVVDPLYAGAAGRPAAEAASAEFALEEVRALVAHPPRASRVAPNTAATDPPPDRREGSVRAPAVEPPRASLPAQEDAIPADPRPDPQTPTRPAQPSADERAPRPFEFPAQAIVTRASERAEPLVPRPAFRHEANRDRQESSRPMAQGRAEQAAPDEIRINIGRVEVIAAPPPSPRAAQRPNRATSLEDYLRSVSARRR